MRNNLKIILLVIYIYTNICKDVIGAAYLSNITYMYDTIYNIIIDILVVYR